MIRAFLAAMAACLTLFLSPAVAAQDAELWQRAQFGMTPEEVLAIHPRAQPVADPQTLFSGARELLQIPDFVLLNEQYRVRFYFQGQLLEQVTLSFVGEPAQADFEGIVGALSARYGAPLQQGRDTIGQSANWLLENGTNIALFYVDRLAPLINVNYQRRMAAAGDSL